MATVAIALILIGLFLVIWLYIAYLLLPILQEAIQLTKIRQRNFKLTALLDQGEIQLNSPGYWKAIERLILDTELDQG